MELRRSRRARAIVQRCPAQMPSSPDGGRDDPERARDDPERARMTLSEPKGDVVMKRDGDLDGVSLDPAARSADIPYADALRSSADGAVASRARAQRALRVEHGSPDRLPGDAPHRGPRP